MIDYEKFEGHLRDKDLAENTISAYLFAVHQFGNKNDVFSLETLRFLSG